MNNEIKTYNAMFAYEYIYERDKKQYYIDCVDTDTRIQFYYEPSLKVWLSTYDNKDYNAFTDAIDAYETSYSAAWEKDYRRNRETSNGMIIS